MVCMISRLYRSLCLISFITGLPSDIVALGDSIRALFGEIAENWPFKVQARCLDSTPYMRWLFNCWLSASSVAAFRLVDLQILDAMAIPRTPYKLLLHLFFHMGEHAWSSR